jgi:hypothetical protein
MTRGGQSPLRFNLIWISYGLQRFFGHGVTSTTEVITRVGPGVSVAVVGVWDGSQTMMDSDSASVATLARTITRMMTVQSIIVLPFIISSNTLLTMFTTPLP